VSAPQPLLGREREQRLTGRQRAILDHLVEMFDGGFAHLTMARSPPGQLLTADALLARPEPRRVGAGGRRPQPLAGGSHGHGAIAPAMAPLDALQAYLGAATEAVEGMTAPFARDLALMPAARRLASSHEDYTEAVTRTLLDLAVERGDIAPLDTPATARIMAAWRPPCRAPR